MNINFDPFVLPFFLGLLALTIVLLSKYVNWLEHLSADDRRNIFKGVFSFRLFRAIKETFLESLIHRKIFKINGMLGYMHMSLAFGWFLLIIAGSVESKYSQKEVFNMPWDPIFFNFFEPYKAGIPQSEIFAFMMDFFLMIVLLAVFFAIGKRFYSRIFGMKKTTKLRLPDKVALYSLWAIFPARLIVESLNAANYQNGSYMTQNLGDAMAAVINTQMLEYPFWWIYSVALGAFFVALPFSRYMHIPTEVGLIFLRNFNVKPGKEIKGYVKFEINSCSRCGICIDKCQLADNAEIKNVQAVYYIQKLRQNNDFSDISHNCLYCGRCTEYCPVGIDVLNLRDIGRARLETPKVFDYSYVKPNVSVPAEIPNVMYFAGCMGHLNPKTQRSMEAIFMAAGINYEFIDKDGSICCGRPQLLAGNKDAAHALIEKNKEYIQSFGSKLLVTSCPICLKMFREEYAMQIHTMHHSEFIEMLLKTKRLPLHKLDKKVVYHDPCELGRGLGIYEAPRVVLSTFSDLKKVKSEKGKAYCCGGSLANLSVSGAQREMITDALVQHFEKESPDCIATACPLCRKTLGNASASTPVKDIAEIVSEAISLPGEKTYTIELDAKILSRR